MLKLLKYKIRVILSDIRGEFDVSFEKELTHDQQAAFDRLTDFLADMFEKYGPLLDEIVNSLPAKETA